MKFQKHSSTGQLVRLAALGVDLDSHGTTTTPCPAASRDANWHGWWHSLLRFLSRKPAPLALVPRHSFAAAPEATEMTASSASAPVTAKVYQFPQQPRGNRS